MSATPARGTIRPEALAVMKKENGFLHIVRYGAGPGSIYVVTYHRLEGKGGSTAPVAVEGAQGLIDLLERIGTDFHLSSVRGALEDILRFGSATIPEVWLSAQDLAEKGLEQVVP
jgi:hypothetical protein